MFRVLKSDLILTARTLFRMPGFWVPTVLFPAMLYAFFGANQGASNGFAAYALASFAIYAVVGVGFYQFGVSVAQDRESPFAVWQRSLPGHAASPLVARIVMALVFVLFAVGFVLLAGAMIGGVALEPAQALRLLGACFVASVPAVLMGTALGSVASARAAVPLANLIFLPLAYLGGLWVPPVAQPTAIRAISEWTPTRAMGEMAWAAIDGRVVPNVYWAVLTGWTVLAAAITWGAQRRHAKALFG